LIAVNLTGYDVEVSQEGDRAFTVTIRSKREVRVRGIETGVGRWSFGYTSSRHGKRWNVSFDMVSVHGRAGDQSKTREVEVRLIGDRPSSGFVVKDDLRGFLYCTAARADIAGAFDVHVCLFAPAPSAPTVQAEKSMLTAGSDGSFAIAHLQPSGSGLEVSVTCSGEGVRSARLELERSGSFNLGFLSELKSVERLVTVLPGQSSKVTWSPANGPADPVLLVTTINDALDQRKFQKFLSAIGCRVRAGLFGGMIPEFGEVFVLGDHEPVRHVMRLVLDLPWKVDVKESAELQVIG